MPRNGTKNLLKKLLKNWTKFEFENETQKTFLILGDTLHFMPLRQQDKLRLDADKQKLASKQQTFTNGAWDHWQISDKNVKRFKIIQR